MALAGEGEASHAPKEPTFSKRAMTSAQECGYAFDKAVRGSRSRVRWTRCDWSDVISADIQSHDDTRCACDSFANRVLRVSGMKNIEHSETTRQELEELP